jgi:oxygen-independent coproporphyrinogen-3 oxidase
MEQAILFNLDLLKRYDKAGPRYTSYPTAVQFSEDFNVAAYKEKAAASNVHKQALSLYFHIPFCDTVCFYCACNKIATKDRRKSMPYLQRVVKELAMQSELFDNDRMVNQLHLGGGTPTFISHDEMRYLMDNTRRYFRLRDDDLGEYSIEIDPREAKADTIKLLRELGFNRLSLGLQDFDPKVQQAVNRIQSESETMAIIDAARDHQFKSISVDLIYGLPLQTAARFLRTLEKVIKANPDRISVFNYAHLPTLFKPQRRINENQLPLASEKLSILQHTIEHLTAAGYVYIGMDHFAKPDDELAQAQREGSLYRNFQGYATHADCDLIAFGVTSIGKVANSYSQNYKTLDDYYRSIDNNELAVFRGIALTDEDILRRAVITQLICHFQLHIPAIEQKYAIDFKSHFHDVWPALQTLQNDGLLTFDDQKITVLPAGRLLIRNICMVFDAYLKQSNQRFSKVI